MFQELIPMMMMIFILLMMNFKNSSNKMISIIILMATLMSILVSILTKNSWVGFSLFLMMVGGLMILFTLVASIMPKTISMTNFKNIMMIMIPMLIIFIPNFKAGVLMEPHDTFMTKIMVIGTIILILNLILIFISKMIIMPMKPFRSLN